MPLENAPSVSNITDIHTGPLKTSSPEMHVEVLPPEASSFTDLVNYLGVVHAEDGRNHINGLSHNLLSISLEQYDLLPEEINNIYNNILPSWESLKKVDNPNSPEAKKARIENEENADPEVKMRLKILDELGVDAGMAAHSERTSYGAALFMALYIISHNLEQQINEYDASSIENILSNYKFTRAELQLIGLAALAGLLHDLGKGEMNEDGSWKYQDILLSTKIRTEEQEERMAKHTSDGAILILRCGLPEIIATVAEKHHEKDFTPSTISITEDLTDLMIKIITWIDQFEAATSIRSYKLETVIGKMHDDKWIVDQQNTYNNPHTKTAYHQFVTISEKFMGNKLEKIKERALAKV